MIIGTQKLEKVKFTSIIKLILKLIIEYNFIIQI